MLFPGVLRHGFTLHGLAAGLAAFALLRALGISLADSAMLGWCGHVVTYSGLVLYRLGKAPAEIMRQRARAMTEGRVTVSALSVLTAGASLLIVVQQLVLRHDQGVTGLIIALVTITLSWCYVHLLFAQDYAHEYWVQEAGLVFPGGDGTPEFSEFLYFAFTVGMTFQVSDVTTNAPRMRRLVLLHGLVSFGFNAVILAAAVNTVAGSGGS